MWQPFTDENVTEGWYQCIFEGWIPDWLDKRDLPVGKFVTIKGTMIYIDKIDIIGDQNLVILTFYKYGNLALITLTVGILAVLGVFGAWLIFRELRKWTEVVIESPAGIGIALLIFGVIFSGIWILLKRKPSRLPIP